MSSERLEPASTRILPSPEVPGGADGEEEARHDNLAHNGRAWPTETPQTQTPARDIVRLYQCRLCSQPIEDVVTLPCGKSVCRKCLPESHFRPKISYPADPERLQGFQCPFAGCAKEHAVGDCNTDVILNKTVLFMREQIERAKEAAAKLTASTQIFLQDPWHAAGIGSLQVDPTLAKIQKGGKLLATWALAETGSLKLEAGVSYNNELSSPDDDEATRLEQEVMVKAKEATRSEMDCQVCYALFLDPLTTGCGHTFCRSCLQRILDHSRHCPICRCKLTLNSLLAPDSSPSNEGLCSIIQTYWSDEVIARKEGLAAEAASRYQEFDTPLFICTLAFPVMPTFLHVFEPRYRLMLRRALEGNRTFGIVLPRRPRSSGDAHFCELGTLVRIVNVQFYPDGRSLIETVGLSRFRIIRHGTMDGYAMGKVERIDDVSLEDEEAIEASEVTPEPEEVDKMQDDRSPGGSSPERRRLSASERRRSSTEPENHRPTTIRDLDELSTQNLMEFAMSFVNRMRSQSAPWLTERMLAIYGDCPEDPSVFPWWFASMLPVRDLEKYRLLGTSSVRDRLKICCMWIIEWETSRW